MEPITMYGSEKAITKLQRKCLCKKFVNRFEKILLDVEEDRMFIEAGTPEEEIIDVFILELQGQVRILKTHLLMKGVI